MTFSRSRAVGRLVLFAALLGSLILPYLLLTAAAPRQRQRVARMFLRGCLTVTGLRLNVLGHRDPSVALYAANHASYLDIPVLGALLSGCVFVAKREVAGWPLFGFLARLARTEFVSRNGPDAKRQQRRLAKRLARGERLILFPEGTSTNGTQVRPFKSALFAALDGTAADARVQPVTIAYARRRDGGPLTEPERDQFAWYGEMTLAPHLWNVFGIEGCEVDVVFHPPLGARDFADRKGLAQHCEAAVLAGLQASLGLPAPAAALERAAE